MTSLLSSETVMSVQCSSSVPILLSSSGTKPVHIQS